MRTVQTRGKIFSLFFYLKITGAVSSEESWYTLGSVLTFLSAVSFPFLRIIFAQQGKDTDLFPYFISSPKKNQNKEKKTQSS
jgi:hypothetical protein